MIPAHQLNLINSFPTFDAGVFSVLKELQEEGDATILADITRQFFEDATALLADLDRFIKENNFPGIASVAHTLKGSSATFGLNRAEQIARQIELAVNAADTEAVCCWVECLTTALADGRTALESELEKP